MNITKLKLLPTNLLRLDEPFELGKFALHNSKKRLPQLIFIVLLIFSCIYLGRIKYSPTKDYWKIF